MSESSKAFENQYDSDYLGRDEDGYYKWMSTQEEWELWDRAWKAARAGQAASVPNESIDRDRLVDAVYLDLGRRFDFNLDSPLDMVAYLVDSGLISTAATPTKAGERQ